MALAITATATNVSGDNPSAHLVVTGATGDTIYIDRIDPLSVKGDQPVRGADFVPLTGFPGTVDDYEMVLNYNYQWRARTYLGGVLQQTATSSVVNINPSQHGTYHYFFLRNISDPSQNTRVLVADFDSNSFEPAVLGNYKVLGREKPVVYTDEWGARQGQIEFLAGQYGVDTRPLQTLARILKSGDVLLFQSAVQNSVIEDMYFVVTSLEQTQYTTMGPNDVLDFTLQAGFQEVDRPATSGIVSGVATWQDLKDDVTTTTWQNVLDNNATWSAVLSRYSS